MSLIYVGGGGVRKDYLGSYTKATNVFTETFTGVNLGAASSSGLNVLGVGIIGGPVSSVLVNGNSATSVVSSTGSARQAYLFSISGESGTGTVQITVTGTAATRWFLGVYKLRGLQSFTANATSNDTVGSLSFNVPKNGVGIGFSVADSLSSGFTWSGLTRDDQFVAAFTDTASVASQTFNTAQSPLAVTVTSVAAGQKRFVGASWR